MNWQFAGASELERRVFACLHSTLELTGETVSHSRLNEVVRVSAGGGHYYIKRYRAPGRGRRRLFWRSRVRSEWNNLGWLEARGIPTVERVAFGETRSRSREVLCLRNKPDYVGVIVVRERTKTRDLYAVSEQRLELFGNFHWRRQVIRRLGVLIHDMHSKGFIHRDLKWRNILVELTDDPKLFLIDCPLGWRPGGLPLPGKILQTGVTKDLSTLDKIGQQRLSRTDRLRFYLASQGKNRLGTRDRKLISRLLDYRKRHDTQSS